MSVFGDYVQFYDAQYQEKDYKAECDFLEQVFIHYGQGSEKSMPDMGSGTDGNAIPLEESGYIVTGVDRSK